VSSVADRFEDLGTDGNAAHLGILGGTFDPIHYGHLILAEQARDALGLDAVLLIPTGNPHFKLGQEVRPAEARLETVRLAVADNPAFAASALEVEREGVTYTLDTLRILRAHYPANVELYFIMGSDSLVTLHHWKSAAELVNLATFIGVNRPGDVSAMPEDLERLRAMGFSVELLDVPALEVSSSGLRAMIAAGRSVRYLVPDAVLDYIRSTDLYAGKA
jgi:nicotinate-nucleotide adenylyltransferase